MLDKNLSDLSTAIHNANLDVLLDEKCLHRISNISVGKDIIPISNHNVFCLHTEPSDDVTVKGNIILLHDQTNTSAIWANIGTLQTFAAFGYRCWAPDLPGAGRTGGAPIDDEVRAEFIDALLDALGLIEITVVGCSMAGRYIVPLLCRKRFNSYRLSAIIAIALSDTNKIFQSAISPYDIRTPCLVLRGSRDTSLGLSAADALGQLANARVVVVADGRHLCHQSHPDVFHRIVLNFLDAISALGTSPKKSIRVTEI